MNKLRKNLMLINLFKKKIDIINFVRDFFKNLSTRLKAINLLSLLSINVNSLKDYLNALILILINKLNNNNYILYA